MLIFGIMKSVVNWLFIEDDFTKEEEQWVREQYIPRMQCFEDLLKEITDSKIRFYNTLSLTPMHIRFDYIDYEIMLQAHKAGIRHEIQHILRQLYYADLQEILIKYKLINKIDSESAYATAGDIIIHFVGGHIGDHNYNETRKLIATQDTYIRLSWPETDAYYRERFSI